MTVKVGIFWVIDGKVYSDIEERATNRLNEREKLSGKIDSDFEHFATWDKELAQLFANADFATFPRGRVIFDTTENRHIVYADRCITVKEIEHIENLFQTTNAKVCRDEHYSCDKCVTTFDDFVDCISPYVSEKTGILPLNKTDKTIRYKILDGANKIGANLIELNCADTNVLIECGNELEPTEEGITLRNEIKKNHYDACFVTHYHGDHAGLLTEPINCDVIYMSEPTLKILKIIGGICEENVAKTVAFDKLGRDKIKVKDLYFDYFLCDHSAYGSYMFNFISEQNSILYTGDFRSNGRKDFDRLLKKLPRKVDTLICEGTNAKSNMPQLSEQDVENQLVDLCQNDKPVFVLQSATNIDRIVSVYRAALRSNRLFIMRLAQADICSELPNIPQPNGFKACFAYSEFPLTDKQHKKYTEKYNRRLIGRERISKINNYILEVTSKDLRYIQKLAASCNLQGAKLIYSTWNGYKAREDMSAFLDGIKNLGIEIVDLHASGHADNKTIEALRQRVNPNEFVQVHKPQDS